MHAPKTVEKQKQHAPVRSRSNHLPTYGPLARLQRVATRAPNVARLNAIQHVADESQPTQRLAQLQALSDHSNTAPVQRFYVEQDEPPYYRWVDNTLWDKDRYVVVDYNDKMGWKFYKLYKDTEEVGSESSSSSETDSGPVFLPGSDASSDIEAQQTEEDQPDAGAVYGIVRSVIEGIGDSGPGFEIGTGFSASVLTALNNMLSGASHNALAIVDGVMLLVAASPSMIKAYSLWRSGDLSRADLTVIIVGLFLMLGESAFLAYAGSEQGASDGVSANTVGNWVIMLLLAANSAMWNALVIYAIARGQKRRRERLAA